MTAGWAAKSLKNVTSTFLNTAHLLPKDLRFEHGGAKLASFLQAPYNLVTPLAMLINIEHLNATAFYKRAQYNTVINELMLNLHQI